VATAAPSDEQSTIQRLVDEAHEAVSRCDWTTAARAYAALRVECPNDPAGYIRGGAALVELGQFDTADLVLNEAIGRFPDDPHPSIEYAWAAMRRNDFSEALHRWSNVRQKFPDHPAGYYGAGSALRDLGCLDEADVLLLDATEKFPNDPWVAIHRAWVAMRRPDWAEAVLRLEAVRRRFPDEASGYVDGGWALFEAGRLDEADSLLAIAVEKFPEQESAFFHYARTAAARNSWREALVRWRKLQDLFPNRPGLDVAINQAVYEIQIDEEKNDAAAIAAAVGLQAPLLKPSSVTSGDKSEHEILKDFESLGDNCEFGLVQRRSACETLDLFRWATLPFEKLVLGLASGFDGLGDLKNASMSLGPENELLYWDSAYSYALHSHIYKASGPKEETFIKKMCNRVQFLKRKIVEDLQSSERIFLYKRFSRIPDEEAIALMLELERYGPNKLVCVRPPDEEHSAGTVHVLRERLLITYVNIMKDLYGPDIDVASWLTACKAVHFEATRRGWIS